MSNNSTKRGLEDDSESGRRVRRHAVTHDRSSSSDTDINDPSSCIPSDPATTQQGLPVLSHDDALMSTVPAAGPSRLKRSKGQGSSMPSSDGQLLLSPWKAIKDGFLKAKAASTSKFPSMEGLLNQIGGFEREFEEVKIAKDESDAISKQLSNFIDALGKLSSRTDLNEDIRDSMKRIDRYIQAQQEPLGEQIQRLKRGNYVNRAASASEVVKTIAKIISRVHGDVLLLHIKVVEADREEDLIEKTLCPVPMAEVFALQDWGCLAGTRKTVMARLGSWAKDPTAPRIFWLSGMAGIGKTAISQSFCDLLREDGIFVPSFFCSRRTNVQDHQNVMRILPTLATLMARKYPEFRSALMTQLSELGSDQDSLASLEKQFRLLIQAPLLAAFKDQFPPSVCVVDALDELQDQRLVGRFLDLLLSIPESCPLKFFLTSRPEAQIRFRFPNQPSNIRSVLRLHDIEQDIVKEDIRLYLTQKLRYIWRLHTEQMEGPETPSPTTAQIDRLIALANNLFLYASTVVRYLEDEDPDIRLETLLNAQSTVAMASLDGTYGFILDAAFNPRKLEQKEKDNRIRCLRTLLCARRPLSIQDMAELLDITTSAVRAAFKPLHSVVQVPVTAADPLSTFHASFQEYLTDRSRSGDELWFVDESAAHADLAACCLRIMGKLHFNITKFESSYLSNKDIQSASISNALSYGCEYGISHLACSEPTLNTLVSFGECFCEKLLYWLEVLSALDLIDNASGLIMEFVEVINAQDNWTRNDLRDFLVDANDLVIRFQEPLSQSPPHVYVSALPFVSPESPIAHSFWRLFPAVLTIVKEATHAQRQYPLLILRGHTGTVTSVAFSPDSARIVSGSKDRTVRVWDVRTGKEVCEPLEGHTRYVTSVAFSPDSARIVSGSYDRTVRVCDTPQDMALDGDRYETGRVGKSLLKRETVVGAYRPSENWGTSGWVVSPSGQRLFWVPPEFRSGFYCPRTIHVMGARPCGVDLSRFVHGKEWTKCYAGPQ